MNNELKEYPIIKVIGIGGTGRRVLNDIIEKKLDVETLFIDVDIRDIELSKANKKILIDAGKDISKMTRLDISLLVYDYQNKILEFANNSELTYIICNSSSNATDAISLTVAEILKDEKLLTMGICIKDFYSDDAQKLKNSEHCIKELYKLTNSLVVLSNERALNFFDVNEPNVKVVKYVNSVVTNIIKSIEDTIKNKGLINIDFDDVKVFLKSGGLVMVGSGTASCDENPSIAARRALSSPLMEISPKDIKYALVYIETAIDLSFDNIMKIMSEVRNLTSDDIDIIIGMGFYYPEIKGNDIRVNIIAALDDKDIEENKIVDYVASNYTNKNTNIVKTLVNKNLFSGYKKKLDVNSIRYCPILKERLTNNDYGIIDILIYQDQYKDFVNRYLQNSSSKPLLPVGDNNNEVIKVMVSSPELNINDDTKEMYWNNKCLDFSFYFFIPKKSNKKVIPFIVSIYINDIIATTTTFNIKLQSDQLVEDQRKDYKSAFISYSSKDVDKAAMIVQGIKQARPDMEIFFDKSSLRTGENWEKVILSKLDSVDVLFLLWSENANTSEWVDKEWRYVHKTKGEEYIELIPLETDCAELLPKELKHKHCNDLLTYLYK